MFSSSHSTFQISVDAWIHDARFHDACILISTMYIWCSNAYILHASSDHLGACMMHDPWPWYMHVCIYPWCRGDCDERTDKQGDSRSRKKKYAQIKSTFGRSYYLFLWIIYKLTNMKDNFKMLWHFPKPKIKTVMSQYKKEMWKSAVSLDPMLFNWLELNGLFTSRDGHAHAETKIIIKMVKKWAKLCVCFFTIYAATCACHAHAKNMAHIHP